jgi:AraC-like DNA-binding protein
MNLCHPEEHAVCSQYSNVKDQKIEIIEVAKGDTLHFFSELNQIVFVIKGSFNLFCKKVHNKKIKEGELILISLHRPGVITALENLTMMVMKLNLNIIFCERLPLDLLLEKINGDGEDSIGLLKANQRLMDFVTIVQEYCITDNVNCCYYFDLKIRELLFLIRAYYDKKQVFNFFRPIYSGDFVFLNNVYKHLDNVKTVKELAPLLSYSLSGFEKKFKRVFNLSPYQWMQEQKAKKIYHEITCGRKTFTEIAFDYDFSSPAHFNDFCKTHFDNTPGGVRKDNEKWIES